MNEKLIKVYFGSDNLPYKDSERSVHFPIVGGAFLGASNTTKIRFYFDQIGDTSATYVSVAKLPNGKQGSQVLSKSSDSDGNYAELELSNWYTQAKGDVYIALQGYSGGVEYSYDSETELYEIHGTPTIQTTGSIKLAINYAPIGDSADYNDEFTTYQEILAGLGDKVDKKETSGLHAYTHDGSVQGEIKVEKNDIGGAIVQRTENAQIIVPYTPSTDSNATSKKYVDDSIASAISSVYKYKGSVATYSDLPSSGLTIGDVYNVEETGDNYAWTGTTWDKLAGDIDLSDYATKNYVDTGLSGKQNTLVNQVNIKSINNQSLLGTGNIDIQGGGGASEWGQITGDIQDQTDLQNELSGIREIAEGKTSTYSVDTDTTGNSAFKSDNDVITVASFVDINGNTITTSELRTGDLVYTLNTNQEKYKDRWLIDPTLGTWGLIEADTPDLSGYATTTDLSESIENLAQPYDDTVIYSIGDKVIYNGKLYSCLVNMSAAESWDSTHWVQITVANGFVNLTGTQVISGKKTFSSGVKLNIIDLGSESINIQNFAGTNLYTFDPTRFYAYNSNKDLGRDTYPWKDGYFIGQVYAQNTFNAINASDIVNNTLTADQLAIIKNGKPTLIKGTLFNRKNPIIIYNKNSTTDHNDYRIIGAADSGYGFGIRQLIINSSNVMSLGNSILSMNSGGSYRSFMLGQIGAFIGDTNENYVVGATNNNGVFIKINGTQKTLPAYPNNPTVPQALIYDTDNSLKYIDAQKQWYGTQAEYDALGSYDSNTIYNILES